MNAVADAAMAEFGRLDILCANAGVLSLVDVSWQISDEAWNAVLDVNLTGVFKSCRAVIPHILAGGRGGSIVITSSIAGLKPVPAITHYVAAKHGTVGLMRALARELAPHRIPEWRLPLNPPGTERQRLRAPHWGADAIVLTRHGSM